MSNTKIGATLKLWNHYTPFPLITEKVMINAPQYLKYYHYGRHISTWFRMCKICQPCKSGRQTV